MLQLGNLTINNNIIAHETQFSALIFSVTDCETQMQLIIACVDPNTLIWQKNVQIM